MLFYFFINLGTEYSCVCGSFNTYGPHTQVLECLSIGSDTVRTYSFVKIGVVLRVKYVAVEADFEGFYAQAMLSVARGLLVFVDQDIEFSASWPASCLPRHSHTFHHDDNGLHMLSCKPVPIKYYYSKELYWLICLLPIVKPCLRQYSLPAYK